MTPDTKHGASFGAASTTKELAEALRHIDRAITSPRENATIRAAADRLAELELRLSDVTRERDEAMNANVAKIAPFLPPMAAGSTVAPDTPAPLNYRELSAYAERLYGLLRMARESVELDLDDVLDTEDRAIVTQLLADIDAALAKNPTQAVIGVDFASGADTTGWHCTACNSSGTGVPAKRGDGYVCPLCQTPYPGPTGEECVVEKQPDPEGLLSDSLGEGAALAAENANLRRCLEWYAAGHHIELPDWEAPDEPNWLCPPATIKAREAWSREQPIMADRPVREVDCDEPWMVEDGSIARCVLMGGQMNTDPADEETIVHAAPVNEAPKKEKQA